VECTTLHGADDLISGWVYIHDGLGLVDDQGAVSYYGEFDEWSRHVRKCMVIMGDDPFRTPGQPGCQVDRSAKAKGKAGHHYSAFHSLLRSSERFFAEQRKPPPACGKYLSDAAQCSTR
jgi:hypothetical protein